jgi:hypothetical protein
MLTGLSGNMNYDTFSVVPSVINENIKNLLFHYLKNSVVKLTYLCI